MTPALTVLAVCTGNVCRSPAAEVLLRAALGDSVGVGSAGTRALVGAGIDPPMAALLPADPNPFAARKLTVDLLREADLVLALSREHRQRVVEVFPAALRRTFTLREFARILELPEAHDPEPTGPPGERLATLAGRAATLRSRARRPDPAEDDVVDPYGESAGVFAESHARIRDAVATIARACGR